MLHWRSSALLRVLRPCSLALLRASVPVVPLRDWALVPPVVLRPDLSLVFHPAAPQAHLRATPPVVHLVSKVLADCVDFDRVGQANFRGIEARAATYSANGYTRNSYASYGHGYGRGYRYWPYAAAAAYAYGSSYASSEDGCYYVSTYRRYGTRRVLVCHGD